MCSADIFLGLLAIIFPPLPVWVKTGICSADSLINILLCVLGFIPGLIHAWYIIAKFPEANHDYQRVAQDGGEGGRVHYVFVTDDGNRRQGRQQGGRKQQQPKPQGNMSYGTTDNNSAPSSSSRPNNGEGSSDAPPPSYAQVVAGDNKVQSNE